MSGSNTPKPLTREEVRGIGDNAGPPQTLAERLAEENADLIARAAEIEAGIDKLLAAYVGMADEDFDKTAANFIGRASAGLPGGVVPALLKQAEERRTKGVRPHLEAQRGINKFFGDLVRELETPKDKNDTTKVGTLKDLVTIIKEQRGDGTALTDGAIAQTYLRTTWKFDEAGSDLMMLARAVVAEDLGQRLVALSKEMPTAAWRGIAEAIKLVQTFGTAPLEYLAFATVRIGIAIRSDGVRDIPGCKIDEVRSV